MTLNDFLEFLSFFYETLDEFVMFLTTPEIIDGDETIIIIN
jgi:hypothetical protein